MLLWLTLYRNQVNDSDRTSGVALPPLGLWCGVEGKQERKTEGVSCLWATFFRRRASGPGPIKPRIVRIPVGSHWEISADIKDK